MRRLTLLLVAVVGVSLVATFLFCVPAQGDATGSRGAAGLQRAARSPTWALVYRHWDPALRDYAGLDILRSGERRARALTRRLAHSRDLDIGPVWSPDGRRVAFARFYSHAGLYVVDATGAGVRMLARGAPEGLVWSPDGSRIAFSRSSCEGLSKGCRLGIYVVSVDGGFLTRISSVVAQTSSPDGEQRVSGLSWAPDGHAILCRCSRGISVIAADGSGVHPLNLHGQGQLGSAAWSPNGKLIAFENRCRGFRGPHHDWYCDIAFISPAGDNRTHAHKRVEIWMGTLAWTTDGKALAVGAMAVPTVVEFAPAGTATSVFKTKSGTWGPIWMGPSGIFGFVDRRSTLLVSDRYGHTLVRDQLGAFVSVSDAALFLH